ncbi:sortase [Streptococcus merionis]|uniref:Sortase n=2 Tax=Streptococcus merionis TaxID=400065 RepID=A0A239SSW0_9STRE|nr:class C sortase [Streptococcus merionis]SNU88436.1 sortase [Streptococcus merionis]
MIGLTVILLLGLGFLAYPSVSDYWNSFHQSQVILDYSKEIADMDKEDYSGILESAKAYNATQPLNWLISEEDKEAYNRELQFNPQGVMGYITIPKIDVKLSIFHGTDESILQTSIGHLEGTSLPVGGENTHSVLSGHRGLPSARLFSDLDKLREGDRFTLHILDETLTYEVDQIRVVEPTDLSSIVIEDGQDLCTLVTCTPYGVNTHRLLVRGHRVENTDGLARVTANAIQIKPIVIAPFLALPLLMTMVIYVFLSTRESAQQRRQRALQELQVAVAFGKTN